MAMDTYEKVGYSCLAVVALCWLGLSTPVENSAQLHDRHFWPTEQVDGGVKLDADAARADKAQHRRFPDIDVPTVNGGAENHRHHLCTTPISRTLS